MAPLSQPLPRYDRDGTSSDNDVARRPVTDPLPPLIVPGAMPTGHICSQPTESQRNRKHNSSFIDTGRSGYALEYGSRQSYSTRGASSGLPTIPISLSHSSSTAKDQELARQKPPIISPYSSNSQRAHVINAPNYPTFSADLPQQLCPLINHTKPFGPQKVQASLDSASVPYPSLEIPLSHSLGTGWAVNQDSSDESPMAQKSIKDRLPGARLTKDPKWLDPSYTSRSSSISCPSTDEMINRTFEKQMPDSKQLPEVPKQITRTRGLDPTAPAFLPVPQTRSRDFQLFDEVAEFSPLWPNITGSGLEIDPSIMSYTAINRYQNVDPLQRLMHTNTLLPVGIQSQRHVSEPLNLCHCVPGPFGYQHSVLEPSPRELHMSANPAGHAASWSEHHHGFVNVIPRRPGHLEALPQAPYPAAESEIQSRKPVGGYSTVPFFPAEYQVGGPPFQGLDSWNFSAHRNFPYCANPWDIPAHSRHYHARDYAQSYN